MERNRDLSFEKEGEEEEGAEDYKLEFVKRTGVINEGWEYEAAMTALYALKFSLQENVSKLLIATNLGEYGVFDDIIIRVEYKKARRPELYLVQLKNKLKEISTNEFYRKGDFWLKKYKDCYYKDIMKKLRDVDGLTEGISINDLVMCLFTNADIKGASMFPLETHLICSKFPHNRPADLINTKSDGCYKFEIHKTFPKRSQFMHELLRGNFCSEVSRSISKDYPQWAESAELKEIISFFQSNLIKQFKEGNDSYENVIEQVVIELKKNKETVMTLERHQKTKIVDAYFRRGLRDALIIFDVKPPEDTEYKNFIANLFASDQNLIEREIRYSDRDFFKNISTDRFTEVVSQYRKEIDNSKTGGNRSSLLLQSISERIENYLLYKYKVKKEAEYFTFFENFFFYAKQVNVREAEEEMVSLIKKSFDHDESTIAEQFLKFIKAHFKPAKFLALTKRDIKMKLLELLTGLTDANQLKERYKVFEHITDLSDYDQRIRVLREVKVSIQGKQEINLAELASRSFHENISAAFLLRNVGQIIRVGLKKDIKPDVYIKRKFFKILLHKDVLDNTEDNTFIFAGRQSNSVDVEPRKLSSINFVKNNMLVNLEGRKITDIVNDIKQQKRRANAPIHFVRKHKGIYLEWKKSWNNVKNLGDFIVENECIDEHEVLQYFSESFNVVSAAPGMGKTTILHILANYCRPDVLALNLDLNARYKDLRGNSELKRNPLGYMWNLVKSPSLEWEMKIFENQLFQYCLEKKRLIVFIDAFDEIISEATVLETTFSIIDHLRAHKITVWLFTRPLALPYIQEKYETLAINMAGFTESDIRFYLSQSLPLSQKVKLEKFLTGNSLTLYSVPHYLQMLVSICDQLVTPETLKITDLYDRFVHMIFDKYHEIRQIDLSRNNINVGPQYQAYSKIHKIAALCVIYGRRYLIENRIFSEAKLNDILGKFNKCENNYGMVVKVRDGNPIFAHRTYAEYWTALWLFDSYSACSNQVSCNCRQHGKHRKMYEYLFDPQFKSVRLMFDILASKEKRIHLAVLESDFDKVEESLTQFSKDMYIDKFGRTPLHLALSYISRADSESIIVTNSFVQQLVVYAKRNKCCLHQSDALLEWNCYKYAKASGVKHLLHEIAEWDIPEMLRFMLQPSKRCFSKCNRKILSTFFTLDQKYIKERVNEKDLNLRTVLHVAALFGNTSCVEYLIKVGADVNSTTRTLSTPMHLAAQKGNFKVLKLLYKKGGSIDVCDTNKYTPLHLASLHGHPDCVKYLIDLCDNKDSRTTLDIYNIVRIAVKQGHTTILELLHTKISDVNESDQDNRTLLHVATLTGNVECVRYLIHLRANINAQTKSGDTSMHLAAYRGYYDILKLLHENGGNVNKTNSSGKTSLHEAILAGHLDCVGYLVKVAADLNLEERITGYTSMHLAADREDLEFLKLLSENGGDVNKANYEGLTPLHIVVTKGLTESVRYLIEFGAKIDLMNKAGRTAMHLAALNGHLDSLRLLLKGGGNIYLRDAEGRTVLHCASSFGHFTCVQYLIDEDFNLDNKTDSEENTTAICLAVKGGHMSVLKILINGGGDFELVDSYGRTPLHLAIENGRNDCARYLLDIGADAHLEKETKWKLIHLAARQGHKYVHKLLTDAWGNFI